MAALNAVATACCSSGDSVIAGANMYDGAIAYFDDVVPRQGITVTWVDVLDPAAVKAAVRSNTKVIVSYLLKQQPLIFQSLFALFLKELEPKRDLISLTYYKKVCAKLVHELYRVS